MGHIIWDNDPTTPDPDNPVPPIHDPVKHAGRVQVDITSSTALPDGGREIHYEVTCEVCGAHLAWKFAIFDKNGQLIGGG